MTTGLTLAEYAALPQGETPDELVEGRVVPVPFGTPRHGATCSMIAERLLEWSRRRGEGQVFLGRPGVVIDEIAPTVWGPDVVFSTEKEDADGWLRRPALVVEVRDRHELAEELLKRSGIYLAAGTREVWVADPARGLFDIHEDSDAGQMGLTGDDLVRTNLLPGFACKVADLLAVGGPAG